jgi:predicted HD phosphohydrolase
MNELARFTDMRESTAADWQIIAREFMPYAAALPRRIVAHLDLLKGDCGGFTVDRYAHCLQTATRALRDGRDDEYVVCALLHDIGDTLGSWNHPDIAAALLKPFVGEANLWMVQQHGIFQGHYFFHHLGMDRDLRDQYREHPHYERTLEFCERYDAPAFDPQGETLPIEHFMPLIERVFAQPRHSPYQAIVAERAAA